jgi:dolichol-phosphate mannosyltransferase
MEPLSSLVRQLPGPILVIGASGFVGANLLRALLEERDDVTGTFFSGVSWRLRGIPATQIRFCNLHDPVSVRAILAAVEPRIIFDCSSFGAYSFERDAERIHRTNYNCFLRLLEEAARLSLHAYVHAGSSSEYGLNADAPAEDAPLLPNSHYAVSKCAANAAIRYFGKCRNVPVVNLRLYSVYGPYEDSSRLMPVLCEHVLRGTLPPFARPETSRDFIHADDVAAAFVQAALRMTPEIAANPSTSAPACKRPSPPSRLLRGNPSVSTPTRNSCPRRAAPGTSTSGGRTLPRLGDCSAGRPPSP